MSFSTFAVSNRAKLTYIAESVWAVTPSSGSGVTAPREMRIKTSKVSLKKETKMSDELRADRMVPSIIEVGAASEGEIDFEFSAGAIDPFLEAFVYGQFTRPMTMDWMSNVAITGASALTISSDTDYSTYFVVGRIIKTEGFTTPANNNYLTVSAVAFAGGVTTITVSESSLTAEAASAYTVVFDANDVFVKANTSIRFGTGSAPTIDSNGTNAFASAIAAGQISVGQKIHVDGLGFDAASVAFSAAPAVGDTLTVFDGVNQVTFVATTSSVAGEIVYTPGGTGTTAAAALVAAINEASAAGLISVVASNSTSTLSLSNRQFNAAGLGHVTKTGTAATVTDFAGGDNSVRGVFTVLGATNDVLTVSPAPDVNANASTLPVTIKGSMLRNPALPQDFVVQSFTIETGYEDVNQFFINKGLRVGQFDLNIASREIVTGKVNFKGEAMTRLVGGASILENGPYVAKQSTPGQIMSATTNVGNLTKNGVPLATAIKSITIQGDAALREQTAVGFKFPVGIGVGRFKLTGKFDAYFEDGYMFDDFIAHNTVSLGWDFLDLNNQQYFITLPAIKLTEDPLSPGSIDQDVMENISWEAQRDPATNCILQVDRFSSVVAPTA